MSTPAEHDVVILTTDLPDQGLKAGDFGAVILVAGGTVEVEFVNLQGDTVAVVDLKPDQYRAAGTEIPSARAV